MKKIVTYLRCSTSYQLDTHSIQHQRLKIEQYAKLNDFEILDEIVDEGVSGKSSKREGYLKLMEMVKNKECDSVVVYSLSRFSRCVVGTLSSIELMNQKGITFHSITENIDTSSPNGRFFLTILSSLSQLEREITSARVKDVLNGLKITNKPYSNALYGSDNFNGELIENQVEKKMIRKILKMHNIGYTHTEISNYLNSKGVATKRGGKKFYHTTIKSIIATNNK